MKFIDSHHHFWDLDRPYHPFLQDIPTHPFSLEAQRPITHNFLPEDYRTMAANHDEQFGPWDRSAQGLAMWHRAMATLAQVEHVGVKLACVGVPNQPWSMKARQGVILRTIGRFGVDRCMFASNVLPASHPDRLRHHAPRLPSHSGSSLP